MLFFRKNKELEALLLELKNDAANNYKDNAQDDFRRLTDSYREMLKDYTHADQGRKDIGTW